MVNKKVLCLGLVGLIVVIYMFGAGNPTNADEELDEIDEEENLIYSTVILGDDDYLDRTLILSSYVKINQSYIISYESNIAVNITFDINQFSNCVQMIEITNTTMSFKILDLGSGVDYYTWIDVLSTEIVTEKTTITISVHLLV